MTLAESITLSYIELMTNDKRHRELFNHLIHATGPEWAAFPVKEVIDGIGTVLTTYPDESDLSVLTNRLFTLLSSK